MRVSGFSRSSIWLALGVALAPVANAQLEEVIVTAERREASVQDVSLSVHAFDTESMALGGIEDVTRLDLLVPGVNYATVGNDAKFNVRGANSSNTFGDASSIVGTFIDGVYKPRASQQTRAFFDIDRVEFLSGPQGTLYGRNTFAGALNLYTARPNMDGFSGGLNLGLERFNSTRVEGFVNLPVSDTLAFRVAGYLKDSDGHIKNTAGPNMAARNDDALRVSMLWEPSDNFDLYAKYSHFRETGTEAGIFGYTHECRGATVQGITDPFGSEIDCRNPFPGSADGPSAADIGPYEVINDFVPNEDVSEDNLTVIANWDLGGIRLKSITGYSDYENLLGQDGEFSAQPAARYWFDETAESYSQEFQLSSDGDGPLQWTTGVYYSQDETFFSFLFYEQAVVDYSGQETVVGPNGDLFPILAGAPLLSTETSLGGFFADSTLIEIETLGLYAQGEYSLTDSLRVIAGIRHNDEQKDIWAGNNFTGGDAPVTVLVETGASPLILPGPYEVFAIDPKSADAITAGETFTNTSWRAGVEFDLNEDVMLYFTGATGFLSGALNASGGVTDQQESEMYEAGVKSYLLDRRLRLNVAGHFTTYDNLLTQIQIPISDGNVVTVSENGGDIEAYGLEIDAMYSPSERWTIQFLAAYLDSEFGTFGQQNPYQLYNGEVQSFVNQEGNRTPWSPEITATFGLTYAHPLGDAGSLTTHLQISYSDEYNTGNLLANDPAHQQEAFTRSDLRLVWDSADGKYSVQAFIENIEDEAVLARGNSGGFDQVQTGYLYPQNYGVRARIQF